MNFGMVLLSILCFVIGLSILIVCHEFGHYICAKIFHVYTYEFSIGFGKKIVRKKRKNKETYFEVGVIPFGGYVSMYSEDSEDREERLKELEELKNSGEFEKLNVVEKDMYEKDIPLERSVEGIAKWKKFIIMSAGVIMNFILGYLIFFVQMVAFPHDVYVQTVCQTDNLVVTEFNEKFNALSADLNNDELYVFQGTYVFDKDYETNKVAGIAISVDAKINGTEETYALFSPNSLSINNMSLDSSFTYTLKDKDNKTLYRYYLYHTWIEERTFEVNGETIIGKFHLYDKDKSFYVDEVIKDKNIESLNLSFNLLKSKFNYDDTNHVDSISPIVDSDGKYVTTTLNGTLNSDGTKLSTTNLSMMKNYSRYLGYKAFGYAGKQWADSTGAIFSALGHLFIGQGWNQTGGIVMMFAQSTLVLETYPFSYYVQLWGIISVNLGIVNLLPFPGLDGWHLVVTLFEGITRKKVNKKAKRIASIIGLGLLFALMAALIIYDIVRIATVGVIV